MHSTKKVNNILAKILAKQNDKPFERDERYYIKPWDVNDVNYEILKQVVKTNNIWLLLNFKGKIQIVLLR